MEPGSSLPFPQEPTDCPCLSQNHPVHAFPSYFFNINLRSLSHLHTGLHDVPSLRLTQQTPACFCPMNATYTAILVRGKNHEVHHFAVSSSLLLLPLTANQNVSSSAPWYWKPSAFQHNLCHSDAVPQHWSTNFWCVVECLGQYFHACISPLALKVDYSQHAAWCWENSKSKSLQRTPKVMDVHLNPKSFTEITGHFITVAKS